MRATTPVHDTRRLLLASAAGSLVEWYDFFVFASAAALVFDRTFFPKTDPLTGTLFALMTYAVGFVTRPLGGVLFGALGDRAGRKRALVASLVLMGAATVGVGLLPTYAQVGPLAPALLVALRLLQGVAVGGEVGGAVLLVAESLGADRRGEWTAWPQTGGPAGNVAAAGVLALLAGGLGEARFAAWGWRVAFLLSGVLVAVGLWMRTRVEESPLFAAYQARRAAAPDHRVPLATTIAAHWRALLTVFCVKAGENALFYVFTTFFVVWVTKVLHRPRGVALTATLVASAIEVGVIVLAGRWSDRIGRRPVTALGLVAAAAWAFALFSLGAPASPLGLTFVAAVGGIAHGVIVGGMSAFFVELFPTAARYTGFSVGYQLASVASGAVAPIIGVALLARYGSPLAVSCYAALMTVPALVALARAPETRGRVLV